MKRIAVPLLALSMMLVASLTARADEGIPACANIENGVGTYTWTPTGTGLLEFTVEMEQELDPEGTPVGATCENVTYELWVIRDNPGGAEPAHAFDLGPTSNAELISSEGGDGVDNVLEYSLAIPDDDPTICVFSRTLGTRTTTVGGPVDENGNGNSNDDLHKNNGGNNSEGDKHEWESTTTTETFEYDRGPDTGCKALNLVFDTANEGSGGRGYN